MSCLTHVHQSLQVPTKNIEGQLTPYFSVEMGNGTPCVLKQNQARTTSVLYVCHPEAKHEILSVAEVTTCEYDVVVLTPLLCSHPKYRWFDFSINLQIVMLEKADMRALQVQVLSGELHLLPGFSGLSPSASASRPV